MPIKFFLFRSVCVAIACLSLAAGESRADFVRFDTNLGSFDVELFEDTQPNTVANFLFYVNNVNPNQSYDGSIIHRSVPDFIIQGGSFYENADPVVRAASVVNEPGRSNVRGTIAMAKLADDPDSATSGWFFNLVDNVSGSLNDLDSQNGGFTVFGEVLGNGMAIIDQIAGLTPVDASGGNPNSPFGELPVLDTDLLPSFVDNLVVINSIRVVSIPEPASISLLLLSGVTLAARRRRLERNGVQGS